MIPSRTEENLLVVVYKLSNHFKFIFKKNEFMCISSSLICNSDAICTVCAV